MANKNNDLIAERLKKMNENKEALKGGKPNVMQNIATGDVGEVKKPDFEKMAEVLESQKEEKVSENSGHVKDTLYIKEDLYRAMQALCVKQGDKKFHVNAAYEMYLTHIYKTKKDELGIDD